MECERGIPSEIVEPFGGGVGEFGKMARRYVFPIFKDKNTIHGFSGRSLGSFEPRWKHLGEKSKWIFPLCAESYIIKKQQVILVEGIGCVLALNDIGVKNVWSLFGLNISSTMMGKLIVLDPKEIIIATNNEKSQIGNNAAVKLQEKLLNFFNDNRIKIRLPFKKDFLDMDRESRKKWYSEI